MTKNLTYADLTVGEFYKLDTDEMRYWGKCGSINSGWDFNNVFVRVDMVYTTNIDYTVFYNGMESNNRAGSCNGCVEAKHLIPLKDIAENKVKMESVIISEEKKNQILSAISQPKNTEKIFTEWGFDEIFEKGTAVSLFFYGVPGTGKTLTAQAIADELGMELKIIGTAEIESSEPGQAERNIKQFFKEASKKYADHEKNQKSKAQILLFDECDSLLTDRNSIGVILAAQVNCLLTEIEKYKGVVIFTTNRLGRLDPAFERRVTAKIEFDFPNEEAREKIWTRMIPKKAPLAKDVKFSELAQFPLAGGNIKNTVLNAARQAAFEQSSTITRKHFLIAIEQEIKGMKGFEAAFEDNSHRPRQVTRSGGLDMSSGNKLELDKVEEMETSKARNRGRGGVK